MTPLRVAAWLRVAVCSLLTGCALLTKAEPRVPRYFTPESGSARIERHESPQARSHPIRRLRLGSVHGGSQLRERIMYRSSAHELGYYDDLRWSERPEVYLRRALERVLFEERGLFRVASGSVPTLDVELVAFEVIRASERNKVLVQVVIALDVERSGKPSRTITIERAIQSAGAGHSGDDDAEAAVGALGAALDACVAQIADVVIAELAVDPAP
jgi:ABC-type uncharacterized transport system auxiliary subunit